APNDGRSSSSPRRTGPASSVVKPVIVDPRSGTTNRRDGPPHHDRRGTDRAIPWNHEELELTRKRLTDREYRPDRSHHLPWLRSGRTLGPSAADGPSDLGSCEFV